MKLRCWIEQAGLSISAAARVFGLHVEKVRRWCLDPSHELSRVPDRDDMALLTRATNGAVTAADFYETPTPSSPASGLRASSPPGPQAVTANGARAVGGDAARPKRKRHHSAASKKAWRSRKRRAAARAASAEARA